jgi:MFS family permease
MESLKNNTIIMDEKSKKYIIFGSVALRLYMNLVSLGLIVSLPVIIKGFNSMHLYPVVAVSYTAIYAITSLLGGKLGIYLGRKITILLALAGIMIGSAACALAPSLGLFMVGYVAFALAYGVSLSMPIALLCDVSTINERPHYMGIYSSANNIGMLIGPFLGGFITDTFGFTFTPIYPLPLAVVAFILLFVFYPRHTKKEQKIKFDFVGIFLLALGIAPFVIGLNLGGRIYPWSSPGILIMVFGGILFSVAFVIHERKTQSPLLSVELFKIPSFSISIIMLVLIVPYFTISNNYIILFIQDGLGLSATTSGTLAIPKTLVVLILAAILGKHLTRSKKHHKKLMLISGAVIALSELIIVFASGRKEVMVFLYICMALFGAGEIFYFMTLQPHMMSKLKDEDIHSAMSIQSFATVMGICIMSAVCGVILNASDGDIYSTFPKMSLITVACSVAFILVGAIFIKGKRENEDGSLD